MHSDRITPRWPVVLLALTLAGCVQTRLSELPENAIIVDARTRTEYTMGHLACAKSLPWYDADEEDAVAALGDKSRPVVLYCLSGHRSTVAQKRLEALGFEEVHDGGSMESLRRLISKTEPGHACGVFRSTVRQGDYSQ